MRRYLDSLVLGPAAANRPCLCCPGLAQVGLFRMLAGLAGQAVRI